MTRRVHEQRQRGRGFTLTEMLIAVAISGIIGLGVAMMLAAVAAGTQDQNQTRQTSVARQVVVARLGSLTRGAAVVLAAESDHLVLWTGDAAGNGKVNLSELRRIEWDANEATLRFYEAVDGVDPGPPWELDEDFSAITASQDEETFPSVLIVDGVLEWDVAIDSSDVQAARLVRQRLTLARNERQEPLTITASLRASNGPEDAP